MSPSDGSVSVAAATKADIGEIWTLQRAAYLDEAQVYGDPFILPLTESHAGIEQSVAAGALVLKAVLGHRIVGSVRGKAADRTGLVSRLCVAPDQRRRGIARSLVLALEERLLREHPEITDLAIVTGHGSESGLRLCRRLGYSEASRERFADHVVMVHFRKPVAGRAARNAAT
ncbi:GNAT family N-acetyltransferase [Allosalinactinospora lopnorensis]|uniref:GNAT family N-acetyltransferase n=1 Tax=Allosalinactinospora lopnorensis TaxID=1352348 RepID=UPI000623DDA1|nr:GNAT family N-acetyltransferase [Allosalinactinospora lopnorensis]